MSKKGTRGASALPMSKPWYQVGLRFTCTRCGHCCTGEPGHVYVNDDEIAAIAADQKMTSAEVIGLYTKPTHRERSLREKGNGDCVFFEKEAGCTIYSIRPRQCRTWPFWESNVRTPEAWEKTTSICPGSGQGELISVEEIQNRLRTIRI
jgi:Fe-S-cluster containining protein